MLIAAYIVLALAFGIADMLLFRRCAALTPIRLSRGLLLSIVTAIAQAALFLMGMLLGDLLRFELPDNAEAFSTTNALIFLGMNTLVILRLLLPYLRREPKLPLFDLGSNAACTALVLTSGINLLFVGLGAGFVASPAADLHKALWPMVVALPLFSYWGIMLGRRKVTLRPRRWMIIASVLLLGVAIAATVNA